MDNHMTALVSCFARAHHFMNHDRWIFRDDMAHRLLSEEEYGRISASMCEGISFFNPDFQGDREAALAYVVDHHLSPSVLGRSAFCEWALDNAARLGCSQYVIFASGYDSFSLRCKRQGLKVYELDRPDMIADKRERIRKGGLRETCPTAYLPCDLSEDSWTAGLLEQGFRPDELSFGSLLGISYYLTEEDYGALLKRISSLWSAGSSIVFDYPVRGGGEKCRKNEALAAGAGEAMRAGYSCGEMEKLLENSGFLAYEHLTHREMNRQYFQPCNECCPEGPMEAPAGVNYVLAVKGGG